MDLAAVMDLATATGLPTGATGRWMTRCPVIDRDIVTMKAVFLAAEDGRPIETATKNLRPHRPALSIHTPLAQARRIRLHRTTMDTIRPIASELCGSVKSIARQFLTLRFGFAGWHALRRRLVGWVSS